MGPGFYNITLAENIDSPDKTLANHQNFHPRIYGLINIHLPLLGHSPNYSPPSSLNSYHFVKYSTNESTTHAVIQCTNYIATLQYVHMCNKDIIVGLTYLLLMACDTVRNSSQAPTNGGTAVSNPSMCCSTDVNCSAIATTAQHNTSNTLYIKVG